MILKILVIISTKILSAERFNDKPTQRSDLITDVFIFKCDYGIPIKIKSLLWSSSSVIGDFGGGRGF